MVIAVVWQFRTRRYTAVAYWLLAYAIAIFGTGVSDALHLFVGIPYAGTTLLWAVVLALIFWLWYRSEGTLSIHSILTRRREAYYWAVVFATFALGTALGDFTATVLRPRLSRVGDHVLPHHPDSRRGLVAVRAERGGGVLVRLRGDQSAGCLVRRLPRQAALAQRRSVSAAGRVAVVVAVWWPSWSATWP